MGFLHLFGCSPVHPRLPQETEVLWPGHIVAHDKVIALFHLVTIGDSCRCRHGGKTGPMNHDAAPLMQVLVKFECVCVCIYIYSF